MTTEMPANISTGDNGHSGYCVCDECRPVAGFLNAEGELIVNLDSAGMMMDESGVTYPMQIDGQPDLDAGAELETKAEAIEWWEALSDADKSTTLGIWHRAKKLWWSNS